MSDNNPFKVLFSNPTEEVSAMNVGYHCVLRTVHFSIDDLVRIPVAVSTVHVLWENVFETEQSGEFELRSTNNVN